MTCGCSDCLQHTAMQREHGSGVSSDIDVLLQHTMQQQQQQQQQQHTAAHENKHCNGALPLSPPMVNETRARVLLAAQREGGTGSMLGSSVVGRAAV
jgi:hypothetical protein